MNLKTLNPYLLFMLMLFLCPQFSTAQVAQEEVFGKNRVQYHDDFKFWNKYESPNFITYWYPKARKTAETVIQVAEQDYDEIQALIEHQLKDKINLIVYKNLEDFHQSNIGSSEIINSYGTLSFTEGNSIVLYDNGNHFELKRRIRAGIAKIHITEMFYGTAFRSFVRNAVRKSVPDWYMQGLISFIADPWDFNTNSQIQSIILNNKFKDYRKLSYHYPRIAGHALWNYIYNRFGQMAFTNLLYLTRLNSDLNSSFKFALGQEYDQVVDACFIFYNASYLEQATKIDSDFSDELKIKKGKKKETRVTEVNIQNGQSIFYTTNRLGKTTIYHYDTKDNKSKKVTKHGFVNPLQTPNEKYPHFILDARRKQFYHIYEKKNTLYIELLSEDFKANVKQKINDEISEIYHACFYSKDTLLLSAKTDDYLDLYFYFPKKNQYKRLTKDPYDDIDPSVVQAYGKNSIIYTSNRAHVNFEAPDDTLDIQDKFDLFLLDPFKSTLTRLSSTGSANERHVAQLDSQFYYLSDKTGVNNHWMYIPNGNDAMLSSNAHNTKLFAQNQSSGYYVLSTADRDRIIPFKTNELKPLEQDYTLIARARNNAFVKDSIAAAKEKDNKDLNSLSNDRFQTPFDEEIEIDEGLFESKFQQEKLFAYSEEIRNKKEAHDFNPIRITAYRLAYHVNDYKITINNNPMISELNSFAGFKDGYEYPPLGVLISGGITDLFNNHQFNGGIRFALNLNSFEAFLSFENKKKQIDKKFILYRKSERIKEDERFTGSLAMDPATRNVSLIGIAQFKYPFTTFSSVQLTATLRWDQTNILPQDVTTSELPSLDQERLGIKLAYVYDNSFIQATSLRQGTRFKAGGEFVNRFELDTDPWKFDLSTAHMGVFFLDFRHYITLAKYTSLAARITGQTTIGSERILYYLGGVDNWIGADYNELTPQPRTANFAYTDAATNLRGFKQNIRNGSSFALTNIELRIPFLNYLLRQPVRSNFLRTFQIVGFFDMGTAWHGKSPFSSDNPINFSQVSNPIANVEVRYYRDQLVYGYGAGIRLRVMGQFLRLDFAQGIDTKKKLDPTFYVSLGDNF